MAAGKVQVDQSFPQTLGKPFAMGAGVRAALVLTGATRPEDPRIEEVQNQGVLVVRDLGELKERLWS